MEVKKKISKIIEITTILLITTLVIYLIIKSKYYLDFN